MSRTQSLLLIAGSLLVAALSSYTYLAKQNSPDRWYSQAQVEQGATLYLDHCAACHGVFPSRHGATTLSNSVSKIS